MENPYIASITHKLMVGAKPEIFQTTIKITVRSSEQAGSLSFFCLKIAQQFSPRQRYCFSHNTNREETAQIIKGKFFGLLLMSLRLRDPEKMNE